MSIDLLWRILQPSTVTGSDNSNRGKGSSESEQSPRACFKPPCGGRDERSPKPIPVPILTLITCFARQEASSTLLAEHKLYSAIASPHGTLSARMERPASDRDIESPSAVEDALGVALEASEQRYSQPTGGVLLRDKIQQYKYIAPRRSPRLRSSKSSDVDDTTKDPTVSANPTAPPLKRVRKTDPCSTSLSPDRSTAAFPAPSPSRGLISTPKASTRRTGTKYAAPSRYAHLQPLVDILSEHLLLVFVGVNPGIQTAIAGHAYAHPSNRFWHLLHTSGLTPDRKLSPTEDRDLPRLYGYGNTNIVERPSRDQSELSKEEMAAGTVALEEKFRRFKPEAVCIVGKGIFEAIYRHRYGRNITKRDFHYGWQDERENLGRSEESIQEVDVESRPWNGARVFVATSTSGQAAFMRPEEKLGVWRPLGEWTQSRRRERKAKGIFTGTVGFDTADTLERSGA